ncbi:MAG TPA: DUF5694 domain-containing protein [Pyrinomonadaceae bacterium]|nr:DUF5694 domain-containing protein [Pyrinomonadaceae bacterium]
MKTLTRFFLLTVLVVGFLLANGQSQYRLNEQAQVMILGVYHFDNPNLDMVKTDFPDHLSPKKQQEIAEVLALLAKFKPTKIVVEAPPDRESVKNNYLAYVKGDYKLTANEIEQLGYRLAKEFGHETIYLADHRMGMDMNSVFAAAKETNNQYFLRMMQEVMSEVEAMQKRHGQISIREALVELNRPEWQDQTRDLYLQISRVRSKDKYVGADVVTEWYRRNFRIFTNLTQVIESPQDRVLVIFGQGHVPYLREGVKSSPDMKLVEPNDYLNKN